MIGKALERLKKTIDLLGPNMWLHLDAVSFPRFFGGPPEKGSAAARAAQAFADDIGCVLVLEKGVAKFSRAYFKPDV